MNKSVTIEPIYPQINAPQLRDVWNRSLGDNWPLEPDKLIRILAEQRENGGLQLAATAGGRMIGFASAQVFEQTRSSGELKGGIGVIAITPEWQRQGIGTLLLDESVSYLKSKGVGIIQSGISSPRFWPGIPKDLPAASSFFEKRNWEFVGKSYDLVQNLQRCRAPESIFNRPGTENIVFKAAEPDDVSDVMNLVSKEFSGWKEAFEHVVNYGDIRDIFIGRENGRLVACLILYSSSSNQNRNDCIWTGLLGEDAGAIGCVGVAESDRGRGIGPLLMARANEELARRGVGNCYVSWTWLVDFYGKVGYTVWREYEIRSLSI